MSCPLNEIVYFLDHMLQHELIEDFPGAVNGLQFQGTSSVQKIAVAVDASLPTLQAAIAAQANLIIVHHGLFWKQTAPVTGVLYEKYKLLIEHNCSVYSSHLPLDLHPELGNNILIARSLGLKPIGHFAAYKGRFIGVIAEPPQLDIPFQAHLRSYFPQLTAIEYGPKKPVKIGICSGSGAGAMDELKANQIDTFITGELRQAHYVQAQEENLNLYLCGHYATEVFGVQALGKLLETQFDVPFVFIGSDCPL